MYMQWRLLTNRIERSFKATGEHRAIGTRCTNLLTHVKAVSTAFLLVVTADLLAPARALSS